MDAASIVIDEQGAAGVMGLVTASLAAPEEGMALLRKPRSV